MDETATKVAPWSAARRSCTRSIGATPALRASSPRLRPASRDRVREVPDPDRAPRRAAAEAGEPALLELAPDAASDVRIAEAPEHGLQAAFLHPQGKQVAERVGREGVRIGVAIDPHAPRPRGLDLRDQLAGAPPVVGARELQVDDLHVDPAP